MKEHSDIYQDSFIYINLNAQLIPKIPAKRWAQRCISPAHCFSLPPASDYMNGTFKIVDGGWMGR